MILDNSFFNGKVTTSGTGPNSTVVKKLYIKLFPGKFSVRPLRKKKSKILLGEIIVKYSAREWPEKKNGKLLGDPGLLSGVKDMLKEHNLTHYDDLRYAKEQRDIRDTITFQVGSDLAQEILDRGWAILDK